jgi:hypothetical protein
LEDEIKMLRVIMQRIFLESSQNKAATIDEMVGILGALGAASTRLAGLMRMQRDLVGGGNDVAEALSLALREVCKDFGKAA